MKGLEMVKCESLRINMFRITHTGKSVHFPVTVSIFVRHTSPISKSSNMAESTELQAFIRKKDGY